MSGSINPFSVCLLWCDDKRLVKSRVRVPIPVDWSQHRRCSYSVWVWRRIVVIAKKFLEMHSLLMLPKIITVPLQSLCKNSLVSLKGFLAIFRHRKVCYPLLCHSRNATSELEYGHRRQSKKRFGKKLFSVWFIEQNLQPAHFTLPFLLFYQTSQLRHVVCHF